MRLLYGGQTPAVDLQPNKTPRKANRKTQEIDRRGISGTSFCLKGESKLERQEIG